MDPFFEKFEKQQADFRAANPDSLSACFYCFQMVPNKEGKMKYKYVNNNTSCISEWRCNNCYDK